VAAVLVTGSRPTVRAQGATGFDRSPRFGSPDAFQTNKAKQAAGLPRSGTQGGNLEETTLWLSEDRAAERAHERSRSEVAACELKEAVRVSASRMNASSSKSKMAIFARSD
jgi:hypothetical protein